MTIELPRWLADLAPALMGFIIAPFLWLLAKHARGGLDRKPPADTPAE